MVALAVAMVLGTVPIIGAARGNAGLEGAGAACGAALSCWSWWRRPAWWRSFLRDDFSVVYVATNSTRALPLRYRSPRSGAATKARCCCGC